MLVLIDNGHGEETAGKRSPDSRLREWQWNREMAQMISRGLTMAGIDSRLLVPGKEDMSLSERVRRVNGWCDKLGKNNVLLVSIHVNAAPEGLPKIFVRKDREGTWKTCRGFSVYVSKNASEGSRRLARMLYERAVELGLKGNRAEPKDGYWVQSLAMTRDTRCVAVLTESGFQDNEQDVAYLLSEEGKRVIADMHVECIKQWLREFSYENSWGPRRSLGSL